MQTSTLSPASARINNPLRAIAAPLAGVPLDGAQRVRPELIPLAAFLSTEGYTEIARHHILTHVAGGGRLDEMVEESWLEQRDYSSALRYVRETIGGLGDLANLLDPILSERGGEMQVITELGFTVLLPCGEMVVTYLPSPRDR